MPSDPTASAARPLAVWRDMDHRYRRVGFSVWLTGAEVSIGRRLYRARWAFRGRMKSIEKRQARREATLLRAGIGVGGEGIGGSTNE